VYELSQLSLKFERHFDAEIVEFQAWPPPRLLSLLSSRVSALTAGRQIVHRVCMKGLVPLHHFECGCS